MLLINNLNILRRHQEAKRVATGGEEVSVIVNWLPPLPIPPLRREGARAAISFALFDLDFQAALLLAGRDELHLHRIGGAVDLPLNGHLLRFGMATSVFHFRCGVGGLAHIGGILVRADSMGALPGGFQLILGSG